MTSLNTIVEQRNKRGYSYNFELDDDSLKKHGGLYTHAKVSVYFDSGAKSKESSYERPSGYRIAIRPYGYTLKDAGVSYFSSLSFMVRDGSKFGHTILKKIADQLDFKSVATLYGEQNYSGILELVQDIEA